MPKSLAIKPVMTYEYYHQVKRGTTPKTAPSYIAPEKKEEKKPNMDKYRCKVCGYVYDPAQGDPDGGIKPGIAFCRPAGFLGLSGLRRR